MTFHQAGQIATYRSARASVVVGTHTSAGGSRYPIPRAAAHILGSLSGRRAGLYRWLVFRYLRDVGEVRVSTTFHRNGTAWIFLNWGETDLKVMGEKAGSSEINGLVGKFRIRCIAGKVIHNSTTRLFSPGR